MIARPDPNACVADRSLFAIARERGLSPEQCARTLQPAGAIYFAMDEQDVSRILAHPMTVVGSDGLAHDPAPHPRLWGTFPRVLGHYSLREKLFPLETAVHKMTGLSAQRYGFDVAHGDAAPRGRIAPGMAADLVLFDPETIMDQATFEHPSLPARGITRVYVNGVWSASEGRTRVERGAGRVRKRQSAARATH